MPAPLPPTRRHVFKLGLDVDMQNIVTAIQCDHGPITLPQKFTRARLVDPDPELTVMVDPMAPQSLPALGAAGVRPGTTVSLQVDVSWAPTRVGENLAATLRVESNDPARGTLDIPITANTQAVDPPILRVDPAGGLDFGAVRVGMSAQRSFTVHNDGASDLPIMPMTLAGRK